MTIMLPCPSNLFSLMVLAVLGLCVFRQISRSRTTMLLWQTIPLVFFAAGAWLVYKAYLAAGLPARILWSAAAGLSFYTAVRRYTALRNAVLQEWASARQLMLLSTGGGSWKGRPWTSRSQTAWFVTVMDASGKKMNGWIVFGSRWGMDPGKVTEYLSPVSLSV